MEKRIIRVNVQIWILSLAFFVISEEYLGKMMLAFSLSGLCICFVLIYNFMHIVVRQRSVTYRLIVSWCIMVFVGGAVLWNLYEIGWIGSHRGFIGLGSHGMEYLLFPLMHCLCLIEVILLEFWKMQKRWNEKRRNL